MLKCLRICLQGSDSSIDACRICNSLLVMLRHSSSCATEVCRLCDGIVLLYASEYQPCLVQGSITGQLLSPGSPAREQLKADLRSQFEELLVSEDETTSGSDSDSTNIGQSFDVVDSQNSPPLDHQVEGMEGINEPLDQNMVQGICS